MTTATPDKLWFKPYGRHLSEHGVGVLFGLFTEGWSISRAAKHFGITYTGCWRRYRQWSKTPLPKKDQAET